MSLKKQGRYRFHNFEVDLAHRSFRREGHTVTISSKTFDLLVFLVLNSQRIVSEDELIDALWPDSHAEESNLSKHVFLLRKALSGTESGDKLIVAIPGRGYQFTPSVTEVPQVDIVRRELLLQNAADPVTRDSVEEAAGHHGNMEAESYTSNRGPRFFAAFRHPGSWQVAIFTAILAAIGFGSLFAWRWFHRSIPDSLGLVIGDLSKQHG
jgi:DNA-binding winged helix-turn-helix (wHTH) protein